MNSLANRLRRTFVCWLLMLFALLKSADVMAAAESPVTTFDAANKFYEQGKFSEAAAAYQALLKSGHTSAALYFNLGNALFKSGQMGRAIAAFRSAERLTPRDPDIRANLQFARNQVQGPTLSVPAWQRWLTRLNLNEWTCFAAVTIWLWFALLIVPQWRPALKPALRAYIVLLGCIVVLICGCLAMTAHVEFARKAIVIAPEATVRQGPLDESPSVFTAHDGAEFQVLDQKNEWLQVSSEPRRIGWVRRDQVLVAPQG